MIVKSLTPEIFDLLLEIESLGFRLCLVGGAVRDFLLTKQLGKDLDFEIRAQDNKMSPDEWELFYKKLPSFLSKKKLKYTSHPYLITTVNFYGHDLEFSSPRCETAVAGNTTHHHFTAQLDPRLNYKDSFKRRDFTINAIGIELNLAASKELFVDPFDGIKDIDKKILRHIDEYFFEDSVRFLRLIRFSLCLEGFTIFPATLRDLPRFNLSDLPLFHLKKEIIKSRQAAAFINKFREFVVNSHLALKPSMTVMIKFELPVQLTSIEQIAGYLSVEHEKEAQEFVKLLSLQEKLLKDCKSFLNSFRYLKSFDVSLLRDYLKNGLADSQAQALLKEVKNLHAKKEWFYLTDYMQVALFNWKDFVIKKNPDIKEDQLNSLPITQRSLFVIYLKMLAELKL